MSLIRTLTFEDAGAIDSGGDNFDNVVNDVTKDTTGGLGFTDKRAKVAISAGTNEYATFDVTANASGTFRCRFYFDPNQITMTNGDTFYLFEVDNDTPTVVGHMRFRRQNSNYQISCGLYTDVPAEVNSSWYEIGDCPHYFEYILTRATNATSNDGTATLRMDGNQILTVTGQDNYDKFYNFYRIYLGGIASVDAGTSGDIYLDEIVVRDDATVIDGLDAPGGYRVAAFDYQVPHTSNRAAGSWNITSALCGENTPDVVIATLSNLNIPGVGERSDTVITAGITDGTNDYACCTGQKNTTIPTDANRRMSNAGFIVATYPQNGDINGVLSSSSFIKNGITVTVTDDFNQALRINVMMIWGQTNFSVGIQDMPNAIDGTDSIVFGWQLATMITFSCGLKTADINLSANQNIITAGFVSYDGATIEQRCLGYDSTHNQTPVDVRNNFRDNRFTAQVDGAGGVPDWYGECTSITSTTFNFANRNEASANDAFIYFASADLDSTVLDMLTIAVAGVSTYTFGSRLNMLYMLLSNMDPGGYNAVNNDGRSGCFGLGMSTEWGDMSIQVTMDNNSNPAVCESEANQEIQIDNDAGNVDQYNGVFDSVTSTEWKIDWTNVVDANQRMIAGLGLHGELASISTHPANQTVAVGANATFSVTESDTDTYQWQENDGGWANLAGETSSSYTKNNCQQADSGKQYRVVLTNNFGDTTSNAADLTVTGNHIDTSLYVNNQLKLRI
jgi:hypothetical protein